MSIVSVGWCVVVGGCVVVGPLGYGFSVLV